MIAHNCVWITGASDGIGRSLALLLAQHFKQGDFGGDGKLILSGRNAQKIQALGEECKRIHPQLEIHAEIFDCSDIDQTMQATENIAHEVDVVVFCAGQSQRAFTFDLDFENELNIQNINFLSPVQSAKILVKTWMTEKSPSAQIAAKKIIYISSVAAHIPSPLRGMYCASKRALEFYCNISRNELRKKGVTHIYQSLVIPGFVHTNISKKAVVKRGTVWGKMDLNQEKGMSSEQAAKRIVSMMEANQKDIFIGMNASLHIMLFLLKFFKGTAQQILSKVNTAR